MLKHMDRIKSLTIDPYISLPIVLSTLQFPII